MHSSGNNTAISDTSDTHAAHAVMQDMLSSEINTAISSDSYAARQVLHISGNNVAISSDTHAERHPLETYMQYSENDTAIARYILAARHNVSV